MQPGSTPAVLPMTAEELKERLDRGESLALLDVREDEEHAYCAILRGGLHVPMGQIPGRLEEIRLAAARTPLVVYCHHGVRSMTAATWLARQGVAPIYNLEDGIDAWSRRVDPSVKRY